MCSCHYDFRMIEVPRILVVFAFKHNYFVWHEYSERFKINVKYQQVQNHPQMILVVSWLNHKCVDRHYLSKPTKLSLVTLNMWAWIPATFYKQHLSVGTFFALTHISIDSYHLFGANILHINTWHDTSPFRSTTNLWVCWPFFT